MPFFTLSRNGPEIGDGDDESDEKDEDEDNETEALVVRELNEERIIELNDNNDDKLSVEVNSINSSEANDEVEERIEFNDFEERSVNFEERTTNTMKWMHKMIMIRSIPC